jgi:hypothetical protein
MTPRARFENAREHNLELAIEHYRAAARRDRPYPKSLRRLGELMKIRGDNPAAIH